MIGVMRSMGVFVAAVVGGSAACGSVSTLPDAGGSSDGPGATIDGPPGSADACANRVLLDGSVPYNQQGWLLTSGGPAFAGQGPDPTATQIQTDTGPNGEAGYALLSLPGAVPTGAPFRIEWEVLVLEVDPHNLFDAGVVLMASYGGGFGLPEDRAQMVFIDRDRVGWADESQIQPANAVDMAFHRYTFTVDATRRATLERDDGSISLVRQNFTTNGTIAIGDQTNDTGVDGNILVRRITLLNCP
jgi:hypothetical protein